MKTKRLDYKMVVGQIGSDNERPFFTLDNSIICVDGYIVLPHVKLVEIPEEIRNVVREHLILEEKYKMIKLYDLCDIDLTEEERNLILNMDFFNDTLTLEKKPLIDLFSQNNKKIAGEIESLVSDKMMAGETLAGLRIALARNAMNHIKLKSSQQGLQHLSSLKDACEKMRSAMVSGKRSEITQAIKESNQQLEKQGYSQIKLSDCQYKIALIDDIQRQEPVILKILSDYMHIILAILLHNSKFTENLFIKLYELCADKIRDSLSSGDITTSRNDVTYLVYLELPIDKNELLTLFDLYYTHNADYAATKYVEFKNSFTEKSFSDFIKEIQEKEKNDLVAKARQHWEKDLGEILQKLDYSSDRSNRSITKTKEKVKSKSNKTTTKHVDKKDKVIDEIQSQPTISSAQLMKNLTREIIDASEKSYYLHPRLQMWRLPIRKLINLWNGKYRISDESSAAREKRRHDLSPVEIILDQQDYNNYFFKKHGYSGTLSAKAKLEYNFKIDDKPSDIDSGMIDICIKETDRRKYVFHQMFRKCRIEEIFCIDESMRECIGEKVIQDVSEDDTEWRTIPGTLLYKDDNLDYVVEFINNEDRKNLRVSPYK